MHAEDDNRAPIPTSLFLSHNESLAPPYRVLVDTNFINLSLENRIEMVTGMMDSLYAKCGCSLPGLPLFDMPDLI